MDKKIVLLRDLNSITDFPVVDILTSEGYRLGCATTCFVNWIMKLSLFDSDKFSNTAEMALYYEMEFEKDETDGVKTEHFYKVIDHFLKENESLVEHYIFQAQTLPLEYVLFFLLNGFTGLVSSKTANGDGHGDIIFKEGDKVFYNCLEVNEEDLAHIIYSSPENMFLFGRNLMTNKRLCLRATEMGNLKKKLSGDEKYMLTEREVFLLENELLEIFKRYPENTLADLLTEKELILKATGNLDSELIILYRDKGAP